MKPSPTPSEPSSDWQKTWYSNLIRYKLSGTYFARIRVKGKRIRRSHKTKSLSVAKLRLADFEKSKRSRVHSAAAVVQGKMTFGDALAVFRQRLNANPALKPKTKEYYEFRASALLKAWTGLATKDVSKITSAECLEWSTTSASKNSSSPITIR